jgi:hypothetical protein
VKLALATGQPLDQVARSDLVADAFARAYEEHWPVQTELLAAILEHQSALLIAFLRANGAKNVGKPLRVPRPSSMRGTPAPPKVPQGLDTRVSDAPAPPGNVVSFSKFREMLPHD